MRIARLLGFTPLLGISLILTAAPAARAQSCSGPNFVEQRFPTIGPEETRWRICWQNQPGHGLVITSAHFRKSPTASWIRVFWDARVAEIFVPYHDGLNTFFDVSSSDRPLISLDVCDCPPGHDGTILGPDHEVCKTVSDRGIAWKHGREMRRGEELVLWGVLDADNYNYIVEWTFRDDGVVLGRVGATGVNLPLNPPVNHVHSPTWRLDIDLYPVSEVHPSLHA